MFTRTLGIVTIRFVINMEKGVTLSLDSFEAGLERQRGKSLIRTALLWFISLSTVSLTLA